MNGVEAGLLLGGLLAWATAAAYGFVGVRFLSLRLSGDPNAHLALRAFGVWWTAFALSAAITGTTSLAGAFGTTSLALHAAAMRVFILVICVAFWGLLYSFLYLFIGQPVAHFPLSLYYLTLNVILIYLSVVSEPVGVHLGAWQTELVYAARPEGTAYALILFFVLAPQVIGAFAYLSLLARSRNATRRWRISLVGAAIILWFSTLFLGNVLGVGERDWWEFLVRILGLVAALAAFLAYHPPGWARQRLGVRGLEGPGAAASPAEDTQRPAEATRPSTGESA